MIFENMTLKYTTYEKNKKTIDRHIIFKTGVAEDLNKIVSAVNKETKIKANSSIIIEIAFKYYLKHLETLTTKEAIQKLKKDIAQAIIE